MLWMIGSGAGFPAGPLHQAGEPARQSYDPARPFQTWLFSVANNMCKNAYRHEEVVREAAAIT
jgi:hypothetical protein